MEKKYLGTFFIIIIWSLNQINCDESTNKMDFHGLTSYCNEHNHLCDMFHLADNLLDITSWENAFTSRNNLSTTNECSESLASFTLQTEDPYNSLVYLLDSLAKPSAGILVGNFK